MEGKKEECDIILQCVDILNIQNIWEQKIPKKTYISDVFLKLIDWLFFNIKWTVFTNNTSYRKNGTTSVGR